MCGLTGFWQGGGVSYGTLVEQICVMSECLRHRGPDDDGFWVDEKVGVALGFRRLAILDLSPHGHQPMMSACGRFVIVFNGEVYNFRDLRQNLEERGHTFRGQSDTEVILASLVEWGLETAVSRFIGMFAFALWDKREHKLSLVRDRLGIKPLYYGFIGSNFLFGSELESLRRYPAFQPDIDRGSLSLLLRHNTIPAPYSIYKGIYKLPPGCLLNVLSPQSTITQPETYWSVKRVIETIESYESSEIEAIKELDVLLQDAVGKRLISDVPLGAFLSGGIDSSLVVALMQGQSMHPVKTFTIGFTDEDFNEAKRAREVANFLGTDHTELYLTPEDVLSVVPKLPQIYDEPFSDSSQIPTHLVSKMTRNHVTVAISGDGGDELFGGYRRYIYIKAIWDKLNWVPKQFRPKLGRGLAMFSPSFYDRWFSSLLPIMNQYGRPESVGTQLYKLSELLCASHPELVYHYIHSHWKTPSQVVIDGYEPSTIATEPQNWVQASDFRETMLYMDMINYLPNDILTKLDRATMAVSLEARVPLLDHRVVEFAWRVPVSMKFKDGIGKWLLRQVLYKYVPQNIVDRPKKGFGVPLAYWLRYPLRDWAESLLDEKRLRCEGFFDPIPIRQKWQEHLSQKQDWHLYLWDVLMFQAWHEVH